MELVSGRKIAFHVFPSCPVNRRSQIGICHAGSGTDRTGRNPDPHALHTFGGIQPHSKLLAAGCISRNLQIFSSGRRYLRDKRLLCLSIGEINVDFQRIIAKTHHIALRGIHQFKRHYLAARAGAGFPFVIASAFKIIENNSIRIYSGSRILRFHCSKKQQSQKRH